MTGRQKILKAVYPLLMKITNVFGAKNKALENTEKSTSVTSIYDLPLLLNNGQHVPMNSFKGKKILLVNTASDCGYTGQYSELQSLYNEFNKDLVVIGFPANDFKEQEKGNDEEIASFCKINYGVTFPLAAKSTVVKGSHQNAIFNWLSNKEKNGWNDQQPSWNFSKYLVDEKGTLTNYFDPSVSPLSEEVVNSIKR
ncbi:glutathione peroxidase [Pinibacter aurantiacus]|uniref:Glutathione peroxidase n=1 Tax=Pinibacter aurantiacus TaxID=2851599 RepID=A0A9E2SDA5_9BACT|nr:glutathione peroxidase [Pinibacter aurantiacus]MBV4359173.1 glutathione peroxidase [Pinibacter aurantiacus]